MTLPDPRNIEAFRAALDAMSGPARFDAVMNLGRRQQMRLFDAAEGVHPIDRSFLAPSGPPFLKPVVHEGRNTLAFYRRFAKIFCQPPASEVLWGYNRSPARRAVGPGHFIASDHDGEVLIDYTKLPAATPPGWPRLQDNMRGLSRFVYGGTQDVLRGVSEHVSIGRARKGGRWLSAWFVLVRMPGSSA